MPKNGKAIATKYCKLSTVFKFLLDDTLAAIRVWITLMIAVVPFALMRMDAEHAILHG